MLKKYLVLTAYLVAGIGSYHLLGGNEVVAGPSPDCANVTVRQDNTPTGGRDAWTSYIIYTTCDGKVTNKRTNFGALSDPNTQVWIQPGSTYTVGESLGSQLGSFTAGSKGSTKTIICKGSGNNKVCN